ncbi:hypothetical protein AVEN_89710-1 [Araneus ventricosus]|uniref:Uncharacterized protein n=1 Tax=Araneus ventricosus TaxID=182803 RepID=A0A4Y2S432_ARAVE|nr:hypothetical protein AVEN_89710-1 [Araneus ventricosus]
MPPGHQSPFQNGHWRHITECFGETLEKCERTLEIYTRALKMIPLTGRPNLRLILGETLTSRMSSVLSAASLSVHPSLNIWLSHTRGI